MTQELSTRPWIVDLAIWPEPGAADSAPSIDALVQIARAADDGVITSLSTPLSDGGVLASWLATRTRHVGLVTAVAAEREHPYQAARRLASLDIVSKGRVAWHADLGQVDGEYVDVLKALWDSWAEDAVVVDKENGILVREGSIRHANHRGERYAVRGPLTVSRSPQGHPPLALSLPTDASPDELHADILIVDAADAKETRRRAPHAKILSRALPSSLAVALPTLLADENLDGVSLGWEDAGAALAAIDVLARSVIRPATGQTPSTLRHRLRLNRPPIDQQRFNTWEPFVVTEE